MKSKPQVSLECMVWNKESHGLFDYESKECKEYKFTLKDDTKVYRQGDTVVVSDVPSRKMPADCVLMGEFIYNEGSIEFKPVKQNDKDQDAYLKLNSSRGVLLSPNERFDQAWPSVQHFFSRSEYFVSEMQGTDCKAKIADDVFRLDRHININLNASTNLVCKICLVEGQQNIENPYLFTLCKCQGNIGHVHLSCLQAWINCRIEKKEQQNTVIYVWKKAMECELCKEPLPKRVFVNENKKPLELIHVERIQFPYIVLEQITRENGFSKSLVLIHSVNNESVQVGRGNHCEIRSSDISVSRMHATLNFCEQQDCWLLEDQNSKFGTLVILRDNVVLDTELKEVQIGRIVLKMKLVSKSPISIQQKLTQLPQAKQIDDEGYPD